jgi:hypothetical protein
LTLHDPSDSIRPALPPRGQLLSLYMIVTLGGAAGGQLLLNVADPAGVHLFILVSILVSLSSIPLVLSTGPTPAFEAPSRVGVRDLYRVSPTGVVGYFGTMLASGAYFGMGAVYAARSAFRCATSRCSWA